MDISDETKFDECCRCCLKNAGIARYSLFVGQEAAQFRKMLYDCAGITIELEQILPKDICVECNVNLQNAFKFRQQCQESDAVLRSYYKDVKKDENHSVESPHIVDDRNSSDDCLLKDKIQTDSVKKKAKPVIKKKRRKTGAEKLTRRIKKLSKLNINLENGAKDDDVKPSNSDDDPDAVEEIPEKETAEMNNGAVKKTPEKNIKELYYSSDIADFPVEKKQKPKPKGQYFCDICGHCVKIKWDLITHFRRHTGEKPYKCETCGKNFAYDAALKSHQKQHTGTKNFICDICGKALSTKDTLMAHRRLHTGELPYTCTTCGRSFRALTNLRSHLKIHTGDKRHPCPVCNKLFYTKSDMRDHARRHTGERPFACSLCPQRFTGRSNYRLHMKIHAGQKDFQCPDCPKTFVSRDSLRRHSRTHSGERAFECVECGRRFAHRSSLVSHHAIHSKTKDYVCDICSQRFGYASGLYVHRKKKHNIQSTRLVAPIP